MKLIGEVEWVLTDKDTGEEQGRGSKRNVITDYGIQQMMSQNQGFVALFTVIGNYPLAQDRYEFPHPGSLYGVGYAQSERLSDTWFEAVGSTPAYYQQVNQFAPPSFTSEIYYIALTTGGTNAPSINGFGPGIGAGLGNEAYGTAVAYVSFASPCVQTPSQFLTVYYRILFPGTQVGGASQNSNFTPQQYRQFCRNMSGAGVVFPNSMFNQGFISTFQVPIPSALAAQGVGALAPSYGSFLGAGLTYGVGAGVVRQAPSYKSNMYCNMALADHVGELLGTLLVGTPFYNSGLSFASGGNIQKASPLQNVFNHSAGSSLPFLDTANLATGTGSVTPSGTWTVPTLPELHFINITSTGSDTAATYTYRKRYMFGFGYGSAGSGNTFTDSPSSVGGLYNDNWPVHGYTWSYSANPAVQLGSNQGNAVVPDAVYPAEQQIGGVVNTMQGSSGTVGSILNLGVTTFTGAMPYTYSGAPDQQTVLVPYADRVVKYNIATGVFQLYGSANPNYSSFTATSIVQVAIDATGNIYAACQATGLWQISTSNVITKVTGNPGTGCFGVVYNPSSSAIIALFGTQGGGAGGLCSVTGTTVASTYSLNLEVITGSVSSGTFVGGETLTQTTTGATAESLTVGGSQFLVNFLSGTPDATHTWVGGTSGAVFTPTTVPVPDWNWVSYLVTDPNAYDLLIVRRWDAATVQYTSAVWYSLNPTPPYSPAVVYFTGESNYSPARTNVSMVRCSPNTSFWVAQYGIGSSAIQWQKLTPGSGTISQLGSSGPSVNSYTTMSPVFEYDLATTQDVLIAYNGYTAVSGGSAPDLVSITSANVVSASQLGCNLIPYNYGGSWGNGAPQGVGPSNTLASAINSATHDLYCMVRIDKGAYLMLNTVSAPYFTVYAIMTPLVFDGSMGGGALGSKYGWRYYSWTGSAWVEVVEGSQSSATAATSPAALPNGWSVAFTNGASSPDFVSGEWYNFGSFAGIMKDNATTVNFNEYTWWKKPNFFTMTGTIPASSTSAPGVISTISNQSAFGGATINGSNQLVLPYTNGVWAETTQLFRGDFDILFNNFAAPTGDFSFGVGFHDFIVYGFAYTAGRWYVLNNGVSTPVSTNTPPNIEQNIVFYNTTLPVTGLLSTFSVVPGSGYVPGVYTNVPFQQGTGALATITVGAGGGVTNVVVTNNGTGGYSYNMGLSVLNTYLGGSGSGFTCNVYEAGFSGTPTSAEIIRTTAGITLKMNGAVCYSNSSNLENFVWSYIGRIQFYQVLNAAGQIQVLGSPTVGSGYSGTNGLHTVIPLTGGTGTGATATINLSSGQILGVQIGNPGTGYVVGDVLSVSNTYFGGTGSGFQITVAQVSPAPPSTCVLPTATIQSGTNTPSYCMRSGMSGGPSGSYDPLFAMIDLDTAYQFQFTINGSPASAIFADESFSLPGVGQVTVSSYGGYLSFNSANAGQSLVGNNMMYLSNYS
jgi:hypothetical protein